MNESIVARGRAWRDNFILNAMPEANWEATPVYVHHGHGQSPDPAEEKPYVAMLMTPPCWLHEDATGLHVNPLPPANLHTSKGDAEEDESERERREGGFWISLHGFDPMAVGPRVYVMPCGPSTWKIVLGAAGRLHGALLNHLMTPRGNAAYDLDDLAGMGIMDAPAGPMAPMAPAAGSAGQA